MMKRAGRSRLSRLWRVEKIVKIMFLCVAAGLGLSAGCNSDGDEPFRIGLSVFEVPAFSQMKHAAELARDDINAAGGNVELVHSKLDNEVIFKGRTDFADMIGELLDMGIKGLVPTLSSTSEGILPVITEKKLVAITPGASSDELTDLNVMQPGQHYFFRTLPHNDYQAEVIAQRTRGKVAIIYRDDVWGRDLEQHVRQYLEKFGRPEPVSATLPAFSRGSLETDEQALEAVRMFDRDRTAEEISEIRDAESVVLLIYLPDVKLVAPLLEDSQVLPRNAKYYIPETLALSQRLHQIVAKEGEDADSVEVKARVAGFTGVIPYPHSHSLHGEDLRNFECRFDHGIEYPEEVLHYATYTYDAVVIMALAALAAGSTDPSRYVHEVANVTRGGTQCANYAECRELLTDGDPSNDDIDYEGFSGPIELDPDTGNVTDAFFAVYTYDDQGSRERDFVEVRNGEIIEDPDHRRQPPDRPLRECPEG